MRFSILAVLALAACAPPEPVYLTPRQIQAIAYCNHQSAMAEASSGGRLSRQIEAGQTARQSCLRYFDITGLLPNEPAQ